MWFLPNVNKKPIPDVIYQCQKKHEEYVKLADKLIEQHPLFARMVADRFDKYGWLPIKQQPITAKDINYGNKVIWTNFPVIDYTGILTMAGI